VLGPAAIAVEQNIIEHRSALILSTGEPHQ
jgi:hypothetical protein